MRVEELRRALAEEAEREPPVASHARQALARHIRRQRGRRIGLLGLPVVLVLALGAWALLATHGREGTRVQIATPGPEGLHRLFSRTTPQQIGIDVERGIIHVELLCPDPTSPRNTCPTDEPGIQAVLSFAGRRDVVPVPDQPIAPGEAVHVLNAGDLNPPSGVEWSAVWTSSEVASLEVDMGGLGDRMSPVEGYSFFATTTRFGQLLAKDHSGKVVASCSSPIPGARCTASIGHTVKTSSGLITPHRVVYPAVGSPQADRAKDPGTAFALVDLEICPVGDGADLAPDAFLLGTADGQVWTPWGKGIAAREPDLAPSLGPEARGCLRGWLTYEVKAGERIADVRFAPRRAGSAVWRVA